MRRAALIVATVVAVAGCGSSSSNSNAERARLANQVNTRLAAQSVPADLTTCVTSQAHALPISDLRKVASASGSNDAATNRIEVRLLTTCISQGKGLNAMRSLVVQSILARLQQNVPAGLRNCVIAKANTITAAQFNSILSVYVSEGQTRATANAEQFGVRLGRECLAEPGVVDSLRVLFVTGVQRGLEPTHYSAAFKNCLIGKAQKIPVADLERIALNPAQSRAIGEAFGRTWARACIASGIKP